MFGKVFVVFQELFVVFADMGHRNNRCLLSHFLTTLGAQEETDCTSMLRSIDSCQNKVSADQYHLTVLRAQLSTHRGRVVFLKLSADKLLVFK